MSGKDEGYESAQPYGGDVGGDSVSRDEAIFNVGLQALQGGTGLLNQLFAAAGQFALANAADHQARLAAEREHNKSVDEVVLRLAQGGATADKQADAQSVRVNGYEAAAVYGSGVTPPTMAASAQGADDIGEGDER